MKPLDGQLRRPDKSSDRLPFCRACGVEIEGRSLDALGAHWHPEHFVCEGCRRPIAENSFAIRADRPYHEACSLALCPKCACCGQICAGLHFQDADKLTFCPPCNSRTRRCPFCARTLCPGVTCSHCSVFPVRKAEARDHFTRMVEWVRRYGVPLRWPADQVDLRCVSDVPAAAAHPPTSSDHRLGLTNVQWTEQRSIRGVVRKHQVQVLMKDAMPEVVFRGVAAHELGHVWMITENIGNLKTDECEGFCELLAFLYYKSLGSREGDRFASRIRDNPDPIYGGGFRKVFGIFERTGLTAICSSLVRSRELPKPGAR